MQTTNQHKHDKRGWAADAIHCDNCDLPFSHLGYAMKGDLGANLYFCSPSCADATEEDIRHDMDSEEAYHFYEQSLLEAI